jgi:hypothetical protein
VEFYSAPPADTASGGIADAGIVRTINLNVRTINLILQISVLVFLPP